MDDEEAQCSFGSCGKRLHDDRAAAQLGQFAHLVLNTCRELIRIHPSKNLVTSVT